MLLIGRFVVVINSGWRWIVICIYIGNDTVIRQGWVVIYGIFKRDYKYLPIPYKWRGYEICR